MRRILLILLWVNRVLLSLLVLFWFATTVNVVMAFANQGLAGVESYLVHVSAPRDWSDAASYTTEDLRRAYAMIMSFLALTWILRELHPLLTRWALER